ncbi:hypothetical protein [Cognatishimia sp. MH4019]|uniref:hypothetical protein n=1 Tax=Cognatishimia sp. MH4019 TaxID=2854030 RepID=UPI001CD28AEC|nr:hypothetical protein [Cognatishimia sp. MH4019]
MSLFLRHKRLLFLFATAYVLMLIASHAALPSAHVWWIAAVFSILMNVPYVLEARATGTHQRVEMTLATWLVALSLAGPLIAPPFVIIAVLAHGLWDIAKHMGAGVPFVSWYLLGCATVDVLYAGALLAYWLSL